MRRSSAGSTIGPPTCTVSFPERRCRGVTNPAFGKNPSTVRCPVLKVEHAEARPVARRREHVGRTDRSADGIEFEGDIAHAKRLKKLAPRKAENIARMTTDSVTDNPRQD